jgi:hypothetical protein
VPYNFVNENVSQKNNGLPSLFGKNTTFAYIVKKYLFVAKERMPSGKKRG